MGPTTTLASGATSETEPKVAAHAGIVATWQTRDAASVERVAAQALRARVHARAAWPWSRGLRRGSSRLRVASACELKSASAHTESAES